MQNDRPITEQEMREHIRQMAYYYERTVPRSTATFYGIKAVLVAFAAVLSGALMVWLIGRLYLAGIIN